ncbi:hypothetical protein BO71DRAFT_34454 [Aspergillus ellipticus CBS 707.79]|uniref:Fatty acid desaturase domain-containing protein n=1 Tax=Aspergillus ellipticus CBS 707.79 TaxID=1448320 RepID=A0A319D488_9EURO|nr:hypothetical protein BO71DRAFT_34454 [Aspergillus ellipticus CBS 707.79]
MASSLLVVSVNALSIVFGATTGFNPSFFYKLAEWHVLSGVFVGTSLNIEHERIHHRSIRETTRISQRHK